MKDEDGDDGPSRIASGVPNTNTYTWEVPIKTQTGMYSVKIMSGADGTYWSMSPQFSIELGDLISNT